MYHHLNTLTVFPDRLQHNLDVLSQMQPGIQPIPVLKSNAYGHGIKMVVPFLKKNTFPFVCVDSLFEAYELRKCGYRKEVLIMGYVDPRDIPRTRNFMYAVSDLDYARALIRRYSRVRLHLFLDTGMRREGLRIVNNEEWIIKKTGDEGNDARLPLENRNAVEILEGAGGDDITPNIEWIMSHLSTPDDIPFSEMQIANFFEQVEDLRWLGVSPKYLHILASGGLIHAHEYASTELKNISWLARTGIALYGYWHPDLLPALRVSTTLAQIKSIKAGDSVGYDRTFKADKDMTIGILPIGYHDGLDRRFSNGGLVTIRWISCPIVGRVSMNIAAIDISHLTDLTIWEEVVFIDENPSTPVSLERQAERAGMIPYDLLVHLSKEMYRRVKS